MVRFPLDWLLCVCLLLCTTRTTTALRAVVFVETHNATTPTKTISYMVVNSNNETLFTGGNIAVRMADTWCAIPPLTSVVEPSSKVQQRPKAVATGTAAAAATAKSSVRQIQSPPWTLPLVVGYEKGLGRYHEIRIRWNCHLIHQTQSVVPIVASFKNFDSGEAILFEIQWPHGAPSVPTTTTTTTTSSSSSSLDDNTTSYDKDTAAMTNFPSLMASTDIIPSALSWEGSFVQGVDGYSIGPTGGPTVFYNAADPTLSTVLVGSPWGGTWKRFTAGSGIDYVTGQSVWSPGTSGRIVTLPPGYKQSILLYQPGDRGDRGGGGITDTVARWGQIIQNARLTKHKRSKVSDVTLHKVGYQTDNGAMYCFCHDLNCSQTLLDEVSSLRTNSGIPMGYLSFQGAGTSSSSSSLSSSSSSRNDELKAAPWCVDTWGVDGGLAPQYPMDLKSFQEALGIPLQLYTPYFCPSSPYFNNNNNKKYPPWESVSSDPSLPMCSDFDFKNVKPSQSRQFYDWFFDKGVSVGGMTSFECDFMNQNYNCVPEFIQDVTAASIWQRGMADAAEARNVSIQWCFATPTDVLAAIDMPAVTNIRVSFDFCYGESWKIGTSSLLVWALGLAPSKDTLWTTDNGKVSTPGCPWTLDHETPGAELHLVLAVMSTGPVGISDAIGMTNTTLLRRAITSDGSILKPSKAITSIDSSFVDVSSGGRRGVSGYIYGTAGLGRSWYFVSFLLQQNYTVTARDFWPRIEPVARQRGPIVLAYRTFDGSGGTCQADVMVDAVSSGCIRLVTMETNNPLHAVFDAPASGATDTDTDPLAFKPTITTVWERCSESGWFFLGELNKYVSISPVRFQTVSCTTWGVLATVVGMAGEVVELTAICPQLRVHLEVITIPHEGIAHVWFGEDYTTTGSVSHEPK